MLPRAPHPVKMSKIRYTPVGCGQHVTRIRSRVKIGLKNGRPSSEEEILALEAALGLKLSDSFRAFLQTHNGAVPENNTFEISDGNDSGVRKFIPVGEILRERAYLENISPKAYPVAFDSCGNYVVIDEDKGGSVFFWDHELEEFLELAADFGAFLDLLAPLDIKSIKLKHGQVKKAWIDPEFLKRHKEK